MDVDEVNGPAILAVDPGLTTGWVWYENGDTQAGQIEGRHDFYNVLWSFMTGLVRPVEWVCESYTITPATARLSAQYDALYIIGYMDGKAYKGDVKFTLSENLRDAKQFITDRVLKELGWWRGGKHYEHAMDAARHLGLYIVDSHHPRPRSDYRSR